MRRLNNIYIVLICFIIVFAVSGTAKAFAVGETSRSDYQLTLGVTESSMYVTVDGGYNVRTHILRISGYSDAKIKASYGGYFGGRNTLADRKKKAAAWDDDDWTFESVRDQVKNYLESADTEGEVIAASNGDFFDIKTGAPEGSLVLAGNIIKRNNKRPFFAVLKNGRYAIRTAGSSLSDTADVVSGNAVLLWNGQISVEQDEKRNPREAIGLCNDGTVVIVSVDGREPASAGVTMYELAEIMKAQNCYSAINLDGGGSVSFMTKRADDTEPVFRSNHCDGPERNVGPVLLITKKSSSKSRSSYIFNTVSMNSLGTRFWTDGSGTYRYLINGKGPTGFCSINGETYLFSNGVGLTEEIRIGNTTYSFINGKLDSSSDIKAGTVIIGYCGADKNGGRNLIYAYHYGDRHLNIGINPLEKNAGGKMKDWSHETVLETPWYSVRADVEKVYLGNGIRNAGSYFLYSTRGKMTGGAAAPKCHLKSIRMPSSLKSIGAYAFYNKPELSNVTVTSNVKKIGGRAFAYSGKGYISFREKTPPSLAKSSLKKTGFSKAYVRRTKAWKKYLKLKKFKAAGYKRTIKYK